MKLPRIYELAELIGACKHNIDDGMIAEGDSLPSIQLTVAWTPKLGWSYQTGDNSYTGGCYHYQHWAVVTIYRRSNSRSLAKDIIQQLKDLAEL